MTLFQAIVLGALQGLTEFIPVSSSGHLIAIPYLLGWKEHKLWFDVALHMGTLVALVAYFFRDWVSILAAFARRFFARKPYREGDQRLLVPILVACVPAAAAGYLWDDYIEANIRQWYWGVAGALVVIGLVMLLAEKVSKRDRGIEQMSYADYIAIGLSQALALFPGVSRSGITISAGLFRGLDRTAAARFSFLLSTPIILGAGAKKLADMLHTGLPPGELFPMLAGFLTAALVGYAAIRFLMDYLARRTLTAFAIYRFAFAAFMAAVFILRR